MKFASWTTTVLTTSLVLAASTGMAFAKGYKDTPVYKDAIPCPMLKDGFYAGLQAGYDSYRVRQSLYTPGDSSLIGTTATNATGWLGGIFLGYGMNITNMFYLGGELFANTSEADVNYSISDALGTYTSKFEVNASYGLALLPGVKVTDSLLTYLRLGWNWANLKLNETETGSPSTSKSNTSNGFNLGLGMETLLVDNWSMRTEYSHTWYSSFNTGYGTSINPSDNQYTLAVIYHI